MTDRKPRRSKGSVFRRTRADGTQYPGWYIRWTDAAGKRQQAFGGRTKDAAEALLRKKLDEKDLHNRTGTRPPEDVSLKDFLPQLLRQMRATLQPITVRNRKGFLERAAEHFGNRPMSRVNHAHVIAFFNDLRLERGLAASSLKNHKTTLSAAFVAAIHAGAAATNPVRGLQLPKPDEKPIPHLTPDELHTIYDAMPEDIRPAVVLLGEAGLRRQEVLDLTWGDVDADLSRVTVARSKSHRSRTVPLTETARTILRDLTSAKAAEDRTPRFELFSISASRFNDRFRKAADAAGFPHVTPHTLRHAFGTGLAAANVPTRDIRDLMGHSSIQITERYMNRAPETALQRAMKQLEATRGHDTPPGP